jgi:hypothetical protein
MRFPNEAEEAVKAVLSKHRTSLKNKTLTNIIELTVEIKGNKAEAAQKEIMEVEGISDCVLMEYSGDYAN